MDNELMKNDTPNIPHEDESAGIAETAAEEAQEILDLTEAPAVEAQEILDFTEAPAEEIQEILDFTEAPEGELIEADEATAEPAEETAVNSDGENHFSEEISSSEDSTEEASEAPKDKYRLDILKKLILLVLSAVVFIGVSVSVVYYITTGSKGEFHADCTDTIMWAEASVESGHLYDKDFSYACFLPISTNTIMIPLIKIFGFGMKAHTYGMLGFFILLALFMVLMLREITDSLPAGLTGTALFLSVTLSSQKMREIFWGHTIYYSLGILFLVIGAFLYARLLRSNSKKQLPDDKRSVGTVIHKVFVFICICGFMLLTGMDGITGFTLFVIPFAGAVFAEQFINHNNKLLSGRTFMSAFCAVMFMIMAVTGNLINTKLLGGLRASYQDANSEFSAMDSWLEHFQKLPFAWIKLLGVKDLPDVMFTEKKGIPNLIYILAAVMTAVLPIIATCCYKKYGNDLKGRLMRTWVWMHWAVTAVVLMGYICGILAMADWRTVPMIGTSLILSISFILWAVSEKESISRFAVVLAVPIIAAGLLNCKETLKVKKDCYKTNAQYQLLDFLREQEVTKGYATFWNANSITLLSDDDIRVSDVIVNTTGVTHRRYQSSDKWYITDSTQKEYFLLLSSYEFDEFSVSDSYIQHPPFRIAETCINGITYKLLVYDHNIV